MILQVQNQRNSKKNRTANIGGAHVNSDAYPYAI